LPDSDPGPRSRAASTIDPAQPDVDLAVDISPLRLGAQPADKLLETAGMFRGIFEPGQKIERFAQFPTVVRTPGDFRKVLQPHRDMARVRLDDRAALVLGQCPPSRILSDRDERRRRGGRPTEPLNQRLDLRSGGVAGAARCPAQDPRGIERGRIAPPPSCITRRGASIRLSPTTGSIRSICHGLAGSATN